MGYLLIFEEYLKGARKEKLANGDSTMALIFATIASMTICLGIGATGQIRPFGPVIEKSSIPVPSVFQLMFNSYEILDEREYRYTLNNPSTFKDDILMLLTRAKDLQKAPYLWESVPFPERNTATVFIQINRDYADYLAKAYNLYPDSAEIKAAITDNNLLHKIWDWERDSKTKIFYIHIRRKSLENLKNELDKIDPTWFEKGKMPPHIPEWHFVYSKGPN